MKKNLPVLLTIILVVVIISFLAIKYTIEATAISKLQIIVKNVQIQELKISYTKLKLNIEISNPTFEEIYQLSADYNIFIASSSIGKGNMDFTNIPAHTTKETSTTTIIYFANVTNAVIEAITSQNFNLKIQGILYAKVLFGFLSISYDFSSGYSYS